MTDRETIADTFACGVGRPLESTTETRPRMFLGGFNYPKNIWDAYGRNCIPTHATWPRSRAALVATALGVAGIVGTAVQAVVDITGGNFTNPAVYLASAVTLIIAVVTLVVGLRLQRQWPVGREYSQPVFVTNPIEVGSNLALAWLFQEIYALPAPSAELLNSYNELTELYESAAGNVNDKELQTEIRNSVD